MSQHENHPASLPEQNPSSPADAPMARYLAGLEQQDIDWDSISLEQETPAVPWGLAVLLLLAASNGIALAILPTTAFYQLHHAADGVWAGLWLVQTVLLVALGAAAWQRLRAPGAQAAARKWAEQQLQQGLAQAEPLSRLPSLPAGWGRALMALALLGSVVLLVFVLPRDAQLQGATYSGAWFAAVLVACTTGILIGRFIMAQAELLAAKPQRPPPPPIVWPSWMRWVNLACLASGAAMAIWGQALFGFEGNRGEFLFASVGLVVGVGFAMWLAARFDEWEKTWRQQALQARLRQSQSHQEQDSQGDER